MAVVKDKLQEEASFIRFCKFFLGWDYFRLLNDDAQRKQKKRKAGDGGGDDDNDDDDDGNEDGGAGLRDVKNSYKDVDDYLSTLEPLLFEKVKANITQSKVDEEVATWVMRLVMEWNELDGFLLPAVTYDGDVEEDRIAQNDLLLLSREKFEGDARKLPTTYAFALVEHHQRHLLRLRMYLRVCRVGCNFEEG